jgi:hypothetical protein
MSRPASTHPAVTGDELTDAAADAAIEQACRILRLPTIRDHHARVAGSSPVGAGPPTAIYAAGANDNGEGARTRETVQPLADHVGLPVNSSFGKGDEKALVARAISQPGPTLISWQHGEIPTIAEAFPSVTPTPPAKWPDDRFDLVWTLTKTADGWHFAQIPELALPQDQANVIEN